MTAKERAKLFTPSEVEALVEVCQSAYRQSADYTFDREVQKYLDRYAKEKNAKTKKKAS
jgi:hypothetical protein